MPAIRFPKAGTSLLSWCKGDDPDPIFSSYAELVSFATSYGYFLTESQRSGKVPAKILFAETPYPIDLEVFKNQGLYPNLLMIGLAKTADRSIAEDEEALRKLIEGLAAVGMERLVKDFGGKDKWEILYGLGDLMENALESNPAQI
jgi:hypothetical protein